ncbi:MAG: SDR family oxidoreductase [Actinobacteria bacterium]|nr:SDR family oxidoreductase [Actinomycetota bacterium]
MLSKLFDMKGYCSIVTGAAQGLGKTMAFALAEAGSDIVIADINLKKAQAAAEEIKSKGVSAVAYETDVADKKQVGDTVGEVAEKFGKIDVLINNAGIVDIIDAIDMDYNKWLKVMDVNLNGVFLMCQAVGKVMMKQEKGSIINIASMSGLIVNTENHISYNVSKAGVIMLTKSLACEWAKYHIRVNAICPGYMNAGIPRELGFFDKPNDMVKRWLNMTPMGRPGEPEELMGIAVYLASDASSFATGAAFSIDGGYTVW